MSRTESRGGSTLAWQSFGKYVMCRTESCTNVVFFFVERDTYKEGRGTGKSLGVGNWVAKMAHGSTAVAVVQHKRKGFGLRIARVNHARNVLESNVTLIFTVACSLCIAIGCKRVTKLCYCTTCAQWVGITYRRMYHNQLLLRSC